MTDFFKELGEFYKWLVLSVWGGLTAPFRWLRRPKSAAEEALTAVQPKQEAPPESTGTPEESAAPRQGRGNPLRFRPDLWYLEGNQQMAMDVRPAMIVLPKPWGLLIWGSGRRAVGMSLLDIIFLRIELHFDSKVMRVSTTSRVLFATFGKSYSVNLGDIQVPEQINFPGIFPEVIFNVSGVSFSIMGSGATKSEQRMIPLVRRGMSWPTSVARHKTTLTIAGEAYSSAFAALARWAQTGRWA